MLLASQRGKKKTNALQPAKGMTDENIAFGEPEGKKKASGSQRAEGMTDEKKRRTPALRMHGRSIGV